MPLLLVVLVLCLLHQYRLTHSSAIDVLAVEQVQRQSATIILTNVVSRLAAIDFKVDVAPIDDLGDTVLALELITMALGVDARDVLDASEDDDN